MSATIYQIAQRTYDQIAPEHTEAEAGVFLHEIERMIPDACESMADDAVQGAVSWRQYLERTLTLTLASGVASLASYALTGTAAMVNGIAAITGSGTAFTTELERGDFIEFPIGDPGRLYSVVGITNDTALTMAPTWQQLSASWGMVRSLANLRIDSLPNATVQLTGVTYPLVYIAEPGDLYYPMIGQDFYYFAVERKQMRVRGPGNETLDSASGTVTIRNAVFSPVVGATPPETVLAPQLEDVLIAKLVAMVTKKLEAKAAPKRT